MNELLGKTIEYIYISEDREQLVFINDVGRILGAYYASSECCASCWFECITNPENIIDSQIIGIEIKQFPDRDGDECFGYTLKTQKGYTDIEYRNDNSIYGGQCSPFAEARIVPVHDGSVLEKALDSGNPILLKAKYYAGVPEDEFLMKPYKDKQ